MVIFMLVVISVLLIGLVMVFRFVELVVLIFLSVFMMF